MRIHSKVSVCFLTIIAAAILAAAALPATAQEPLRWKFEKGQKLIYNMIQDMGITPKGGPMGAQKMDMHQEMHMSWDVQDVNPEGEATIKQKFDHLKVKMTMPPPVGTIEYDSKSDQAPAGLAAMIAPMYKAMMESDFELTMTARGEIKDVKVPEKVIEALKNSPGGGAMGEMATPEGFKKMISQSALVLPETTPQPAEKWSTAVEMKNPMGVKQVIETTYEFIGMQEIEGKSFAVFKPAIAMKFEGAGDQLKITEQSSDGQILFNPEAGRLHSSELTQKMTLQQGGAGEVMIEQVIKATVTTPEEAAAAAPAEAPTTDAPATEAPK